MFGTLAFDHQGEAADVTEHHGRHDAFAAQRKAALLQVWRHFGGGKAAHPFVLLVAQASFLQAGVDTRFQQHGGKRHGQIVFGAEFDAAHDVGQQQQVIAALTQRVECPLLGSGPGDVPTLVREFRFICSTAVDNGIVFDPGSVAGTDIRKEPGYGGVLIYVRATLDGARLALQIDRCPAPGQLA